MLVQHANTSVSRESVQLMSLTIDKLCRKAILWLSHPSSGRDAKGYYFTQLGGHATP